ncbi:MAG: DUF5050 domain-containing protein [Planctomycetota bacterium]
MIVFVTTIYLLFHPMVENAGAGQPSGRMYWGLSSPTEKKIQRSNPDGTNVEDLIVGLNVEAHALTVDSDAGYLYWADYAQDKIYRCNRDGTNIVTLFSTSNLNSWGIALDQAGGKIYWTDLTTNSIRRMNLDGSNVETVIASTMSPGALVIHPGEGRFYWGQRFGGKILRANLDGSNIENVLTGLVSVLGMDIDVSGGKLYWGESPTRLRRANSDGSGLEDIAITTPNSAPYGVTIDATNGKIYWSVGNDLVGSQIVRANLDGSGVEVIMVTWAAGFVLDYDPMLDKLFGGGYIGLAQVDPNLHSVDLIVSGGLDGPIGMVIDAANDKIYWNGSTGIYQADLDGTSITTLIAQLNLPQDIVVDVSSDMIYWTEWYPGRIRRMNIAQGVPEDVISGLVLPGRIALDIPGDMIYWTDPEQHKVQRASTNGTNTQTLYVDPMATPIGVALDVSANHLYWTCPGIRRSQLDGSGGELLLGDYLCYGDDIVVFGASRLLYWTNSGMGNGQIWRANTDMSSITNLVSIPGFNVVVSTIAFDCAPYRFGDIDFTSLVDLDDLITVLNGFADAQQYPDGDLYPCGGNGVIDLDDLVVFLEAFAGNELCPGPCL